MGKKRESGSGLSIGRKDGECILFHVGGVTVVITCRCNEDSLRLYHGKMLIYTMYDNGDSCVFPIRGQRVAVTLVRRRGHGCFQIAIKAGDAVKIHRDDYTNI